MVPGRSVLLKHLSLYMWISMLETAGVKANQLGDANDGLRGIS